MPGAGVRRSRRPGEPSHLAERLRALAALIDDMLASLGSPPSFAGPAVRHPGAVLVAHTSGLHPAASTGPRARVVGPRDGAPADDAPGDAATGFGHDGGRHTHTVDGAAVDGAALDGAAFDGAGSDGATPPPLEDDHNENWQLVRRAQDGDGEAFGMLYDRYVDQVYRFIHYRVNDRALAEDFTSETFLRALRRIATINYQGRDIGAWFVTIARNIVLDHVKSARHRLETVTGETIETGIHERSTESTVLDNLQSERLMAAVALLGDEQRDCVMLRFVHGLSISETAAVLGKNDGAIKALQHRAVRKLADLVGGELQ